MSTVKSYFKQVVVVGMTLTFMSCASIVSNSSYPLSISSKPSKATITIVDKKGAEVYNGKTPATVTLDASTGFFSKASYTVKFEKNGYETKTVPVRFGLDGWYFGNLLLGGVLGMLIIDPATGAMYKLKTEFINETLLESTASNESEDPGFRIYEMKDIPDEWKKNLVLVEDQDK